MHVIGQQVGLGAHEQRVAGGGGAQRAGREAADRLVDVEERDIRVLRALAQTVRRLPLATTVRVMDEHLSPTRHNENQSFLSQQWEYWPGLRQPNRLYVEPVSLVC